MMTIRALSRSLPRTVSRITVQASRKPLSIACRSSILQQSWKTASRPSVAAFSSTSMVRDKEGEVDQELSAKLESELQMEKEMTDTEELPLNLKDFLTNSPFELHDTPGQEEVVITRTFGDEKIRITFSIADLNTLDQDPDQYDDDKAMYDEDSTDLPPNMQQGGAQSKAAINQRSKGGNFNTAPEDSVAPADRDDLADDELPVNDEDNEEPNFPVNVHITVEKPGITGALQVEAIAQDGIIDIANIFYFSKADYAEPKTAELSWSRRGIYTGPPYGNLDQDLQVLMERYLDERGINTAMALWIPEYIDFKEQREYLSWLSDVKAFVDA